MPWSRLPTLTVLVLALSLSWSALAADGEEDEDTDDDTDDAAADAPPVPAPDAETAAQPAPEESTARATARRAREEVLSWVAGEPARLDEFVVTAERTRVPLDQTTRAAQVVTGEEIRERIARTTPEALREATGILVQRTGLGGGSPFVRGLTGNQVLVLVDGVRLNNSTFRGGPNQYLNTIDPLFIDRIEVVRGIGSVLYGSDALGGVIQVFTKHRARYDSGFGLGASLLGRADTAGREESAHAFVTMNASPHVGLTGAWTLRTFGDLDGGGNLGPQKPSGYDVQDFAANLDFPLARGHVLGLGYQNSTAWHVPNFAPADPIDEFNPQRRDLFTVGYRADDLSPVVSAIEATASLHRQEEGRRRVAADSPSVLTRDRDTVMAWRGGLTFETRFASFLSAVWGAEYVRDEIDSRRRTLDLATGAQTAATPRFADGAIYQSAAGFVAFQASPLYWMRLVPGVRYSWFRVDADLADPTLGDLTFDSVNDDLTWCAHLALDATRRHHFLLGVARGFRVPSIDDLTKLGPEDGRYDIPNEELAPEQAITYEAGYRMTYANARANVFGWYTRLNDLIARKPATLDGAATVGTDTVSRNENVGEAYLWGVEGDLILTLPPNWLVGTAMSYTYGRNETDGEPLRRVPPFLGNARLRYTTDDQRFFFEPYVLFATKQDRLSAADKTDVRIPEGGTPGFVTYNLLLGFHFSRHIRFNLLGENLSDVKYKTHGSGIYEAGRNFRGELEVFFGL
jgi:outer membrane receptor protein involved in Fe transport